MTDQRWESEPEVVYHYTTIDAMMKIVKDKTIWATSISYLNDTSERDHYLGLVRDRIPEYRQTHPLDDPDIFDEFLREFDSGLEYRPFVTSFSEEDDSLPQWRSYCPQGNGVAIGFTVECLKRSRVEEIITLGELKDFADAFAPSRLSFKKVEYLDGSSGETLDQDITVAMGEAIMNAEQVAAVDEAADEVGRSRYDSGAFFKAIIEGNASFKKHPSFLSEKEHRLLVDRVFMSNYLEFRTTRSTLVPYIRMIIPRLHSRYDSSPEPLTWPIDEGRGHFVGRVVVGPTPNKELSLAALKAFFDKHALNVEVVPSTAPYRDW
jgi:hypothetical protein